MSAVQWPLSAYKHEVRFGGTCLYSQHLVTEGRMILGLGSDWLHSKLQVCLVYTVMPRIKIIKLNK